MRRRERGRFDRPVHIGPWVAVLVVVHLVVAACRSRDDGATVRRTDAPGANATERASPSAVGPTMPVGLLAAPASTGVTSGAPRAIASAGARAVASPLRATRAATTGEWIELQRAAPGDPPRRTATEHVPGGSLFVPLEAMTLLHASFVRALPGFDAFAPHLFDADACKRLRVELAVFAKDWGSVGTAEAARARWGDVSTTVRTTKDDSEWRAAQSALSATVDEIARFADERAQKNEGFWVLSVAA